MYYFREYRAKIMFIFDVNWTILLNITMFSQIQPLTVFTCKFNEAINVQYPILIHILV